MSSEICSFELDISVIRTESENYNKNLRTRALIAKDFFMTFFSFSLYRPCDLFAPAALVAVYRIDTWTRSRQNPKSSRYE